MKILVVGDPHGKVEDLDDLRALMNYVHGVAVDEAVDFVLLLGDQNHHHSLVHVQVQQFWLETIEKFTKPGLVMMVGNHDLAGTGDSRCHSLLPYQGRCFVVDRPVQIKGVLFVPYTEQQDAFVQACRENADIKTVFCHQTFNGSKYENGFYAKDGFDADSIPQQHVISGHIHAPQEFGKVWYPGSPRWQTIADANVDRAIWVVTITDGVPVKREAFGTNHVCRRIVHVVDAPGSPYEPSGPSTDRVVVDIVGPVEFVEQRKKELKGTGARIRTFPQGGEAIKVKESDGIPVAFKKFFDSFQTQHGTQKSTLAKMAKEQLDVVLE